MRAELTEEQQHVNFMIKEALFFTVVAGLVLAYCLSSQIWINMC
jgi:hypothetical protein